MKNTMKKVVKFAKWAMIGMGILFALVLIILVKDISNDDTQVITAEKIEEPKEVETIAQPIQTDKKASSALEQVHLEILQDSFKETAQVTFDEEKKAFKIQPIDDGMITAIAMVSNGGLQSEYTLMINNFVEMSKMLEQNLGSGYTLAMLNPANPDNVILMIMDGQIVYNFI